MPIAASFSLFYLALAACEKYWSTTKNVFISNGDHLELFHTFRVPGPSLCTKGCLDLFEKVGKNLQRLDEKREVCECFLADVLFMVDFSDAPPMIDIVITYHR